MALDMKSIRSRIGGEAMRALSDHADSLCLVKECRELEEVFGTSYTDVILGGAEDVEYTMM